MEKVHKVLILSRGDSARGPLAAALVHILSKGHIEVFRAGISPQYDLHPMVIEKLRELGVEGHIDQPCGLYEYWREGAQEMDSVLGICSEASHKAFSKWPGQASMQCLNYFNDLELRGRPNVAPVFPSAEAKWQLERKEELNGTFRRLVEILSLVVSAVMKCHDRNFILGKLEK